VNPQAEKINQVIVNSNPNIFDMLSEKARNIYFPHSGILGQTAEAKGLKYNATIGIANEDDASPMRLETINTMIDLKPSEVFPYAPSFGNKALREQWKEMISTKNPNLSGKNFSLPVVTQALTHGLSLAGFMFLNEGEEIIIPKPFWGNYTLLFQEVLGAKVTSIPCFKNNSSFDIEALQQCLAEREGKKVVLLLNFPNNPTGYTPLESEVKEISKVLRESANKGTKIVCLIDDAYFGLVYEEGVARESIFADLADAHENILAVKIDGATKEDYAWGLRVGFISYASKGVSDEVYSALADKTGGAIRGMISNCSALSQSIILKAFTGEDYQSQKQEKYEVLKKRYDVLKSELNTHNEYKEFFVSLPYNSGYFMCLQPIEGVDAEKVRRLLIEKYETGIIASQGLIRIAFSAAAASDIPQILENIYKACKEVNAQ
jgi:aspartate/methionine/tyrosine aminotransferase